METATVGKIFCSGQSFDRKYIHRGGNKYVLKFVVLQQIGLSNRLSKEAQLEPS